MASAIRIAAMKSRLALALVLAVFCGTHAAAESRFATPKVEARTVLHDDNTKTESVRDQNRHQLTETVYNSNKVVIGKKTFLLNANGDPIQGVIKDGADHIIANVQFFFDDLGRVIEERCSNTQGEVFQRTIHRYDVNGKALPPLAYNYQVKAANMRPARIDFTQSAGMKNPAASVVLPQPAQPGAGPKIHTVSPTTGRVVEVSPAQNMQPGGAPPTPAEAPKEEKKRSKFNPLNLFRK